MFFLPTRHDGLIVLATNRPYDLDEAMHRRIMVAIEFRPPDHLLRKAIWESHMPEQMSLAGDTDLVIITKLMAGVMEHKDLLQYNIIYEENLHSL